MPVTAIATQTVASHAVQTALLDANNWKCFAMPTPPDNDWNYLTVELKHLYADGDPDLYGLFYNASTPEYPSGTTAGYDFREVSSSSYQTVSVTVNKGDHVSHEDATGVYLCVQAYGDHNTTFTLQAAFSKCPSAFVPLDHDAAGAGAGGTGTEAASVATECSAKPGDPNPNGACDATTGTCTCREYPDHSFLPPATGADAPPAELGFPTCAARVDFMPAGEKSASWNDKRLAAGAWSFYRFDLAEDDFQVVVTLAKDGEKGGYARMFLRHETLPDNRWGHHDLPEEYVSSAATTQEVTITRGDAAFIPGVWYAGVHASNGKASQYVLSVQKYDCPRNCSDRGTCAVSPNGTHSCVCDAGANGPYLLEDCSEEFTALEAGPGGVYGVNGTLQSADYDYFMLPEVDLRESQRQIEVVLSARYDREDPPYYWQPERPVLLLLKGDSRVDFPSVDNYTFKVVMETAQKDYSVELCASQMKLGAGVWQAAVYNPVRMSPMQYWVSFQKRGVCPSAGEAECSGHGACHQDSTDPDFATCKCDEGWTAADCNFRTCAEGSFIAVPGTDSPHQTCYRQCRDGKHRTAGCDKVSCDAPARPASEGTRCVVDECERDEQYVHPTDGYSCVRRCAPDSADKDPSGAKKLSPTCDPATFRCPEGFTRFGAGDLMGCVVTGCDNGTLVQVPETQRKIPGGACFVACQCDYDLNGVPWDEERRQGDAPPDPSAKLQPGVPLVFREHPLCEAQYTSGKCTMVGCEVGYAAVGPGGESCAAEGSAGGRGEGGSGRGRARVARVGRVLGVLALVVLAVGAVGSGGYLLYRRSASGDGAGGFFEKLSGVVKGGGGWRRRYDPFADDDFSQAEFTS